MQNEKQEHNKVMFANITEDWIQERRVLYKKSTIVRYRNLLNSYLLPEFGECTLEEFTYIRVNEFSTKLLVSGGCKKNGLSPKTVSNILSVLQNVFRYANSKGFDIPITNVVVSVRQQRKQIRVFSLEEQNKLCKYLKEDSSYTSLGILLCLFTGLRIGEVCALTWQDISMGDRTVFVHQTMQRLQTGKEGGKKTEISISAPKSSCSVRQIPIPNELFELLSPKKTQSLPDSYLLTGSRTKYIEPRTLQYQFKKILQECDIKDANFHALRHTFATRCVEVGFDVKSLSEILGHSNVNITLNRYVHPSMELKRSNMSKLSALLSDN